MTPNAESVLARRYLLGEATEEECAVIEQEYLEDEDAVDRVAAAEDDLIEDYLADELSPGDRDRFERSYLSVSHHRVRVETIRRLMARGLDAGSARPQKVSAQSWRRVIRDGPWLALAASVLIVASVALWVYSPFGRRQAEIVENRAPLTPAPAARDQATGAASKASRVFALTVSPVAVRSAAESPVTVIPPGTDVVAIHLERDADSQTLTATRVSIRTVSGGEVWKGAVATEAVPTPGTVARIDVQAASLPAEDYLITLYGADRAGLEREWTQYFLRVRRR